ncbi:MAG: hypothetical protein CMJ59_25995 [Planctomycetaceae bacterium]|nr:hypothetical protein [Planctomycetaceae bacterium]
MSLWAYLWLSLLAISAVAFLGLLIGVGGGAVRELKETLLELRSGSQQSASEEAETEPEV